MKTGFILLLLAWILSVIMLTCTYKKLNEANIKIIELSKSDQLYQVTKPNLKYKTMNVLSDENKYYGLISIYEDQDDIKEKAFITRVDENDWRGVHIVHIEGYHSYTFTSYEDCVKHYIDEGWNVHTFDTYKELIAWLLKD